MPLLYALRHHTREQQDALHIHPLLAPLGGHVTVARNGAEAVAAVERERFDPVLMDVQMPEIDGYEATLLIREHEVIGGALRLPILGVTAQALVGDRQKCLAAGMDDYISKPFTPLQLKHLIGMALATAGA